MKRSQSRPHGFGVCCFILLSFLFGGSFSSKIVTLKSMQIFTTHEWFPAQPTLYFQCQGENITSLPDVKNVNFLYTFNGQESWQPLTELPEKKCKRCGLYEKDQIKSDDIFDEWELCPGGFLDGEYVHFKEHEFNATFACPHCVPLKDGLDNSTSRGEATHHGTNVPLIVAISTVVSIVVIAGAAVGYRYWQKKKREQDQARFLKLFEEDDDIEDELGLGNTL